MDHCGFSRRVADFLCRTTEHILGKQRMTDEEFKKFLPERKIDYENFQNAYLIIFNACAKRFSNDETLR
jgi:hypothetical protein